MMPYLGLHSQPSHQIFLGFSLFLLICFVNSNNLYEESSGGYFSGWYQDDGLPTSNIGDNGNEKIFYEKSDFEKDDSNFKQSDALYTKDVPKRHRKRHAPQVEISKDLAEEDITFSDDLVTYEVTAPGNIDLLTDPDPANERIVFNEFENLSLTTISSLCKAQCKAICADNSSGECSYNCEPFETPTWIASCTHEDCIANCKYLTNTSQDDPEKYLRPAPPQLALTQISSKEVNLTWSTYQKGDSTIVFVAEQLDLQKSDNWTLLSKTTDSSMTVNIDDVCNNDVSFRVAAVNRFGTAGYSVNSVVVRQDLPRPGSVVNVTSTSARLEGEYFHLTYLWEPPIGWNNDDDLTYSVPRQNKKYCTDNISPPVPKVNVVQLSHSIRLDVTIHEDGYSCVYDSEIVPKSRCGIEGEKTPIIFDVSSCTNIQGMDCDPKPKALPGEVTELDVSRVPGSDNFTLTWKPPANMGDYSDVAMYSLTWGPQTSRTALIIPKDGFLNVSGSETSAVIFTSQPGLYHVWITPRVMENGHLLPSYKTVFLGVADFTFSTDDHDPEKDDVSLPGNTTPSSVTTDFGDDEGPFIDDTPLSPLIFVFSAIVGLIFVALLSFVGFRYWQKSNRTKNGWKGANGLLAYDALGIRKQAKGCLVDNPFYDKSKLCEEGDQDQKSDCWELPISSLALGDILGQGAFGQVVKAKLKLNALPWNNWAAQTARGSGQEKTEEIDVAVKLLLDYATDSHSVDFMMEIDLMKSIGAHPNVVSILGACTLSKPLYLVVEHMPHGDLLHYLRRHRHLMQEAEDRCEPEDRLTMLVLLSFARQIAVGMEFLSQKGFVHRDLAARNVLVGDNKTLKIGDFGLTRYIYDDKVYVTKKGGKLPLKWMAIESIFDLTFTSYSDVWSYGVVLFELITLGGTPYPTIANKDLLRELQSGHRMEMPDNCPPELYDMMKSCWDAVPLKRPTFTDLRVHLETMIEEMSVAKYLSIEVDENRDYYITEDDSDSDEMPKARALSLPAISATPTWTQMTSSSTDENICGRSCSTNSTSVSSGGSSDASSSGQAQSKNYESKNDKTKPKKSKTDKSAAGLPEADHKVVTKPVAIPEAPLRSSLRKKAAAGRRGTDLFRVSTCSSDELLPRSLSSDGGVVLDCCSLESVDETKL